MEVCQSKIFFLTWIYPLKLLSSYVEGSTIYQTHLSSPSPTALLSVWLCSTKSLAASKPGAGNESTFRWAWLG